VEPALEALLENGIFNRRFSLSNFVVGTSNCLVYAAYLAVAKKPAQADNSLFLYGGVGLGKIHWLYANGKHCCGVRLICTYVTSEEFTNDLINAIRMHTTQVFREKYHRIDVLLIDDCQFFAGKLINPGRVLPHLQHAVRLPWKKAYAHVSSGD
jgi:chromosomal replication initiator protein